MNCFVFFGFFFFLLIVLVGWASRLQTRSDNWNMSYRALAKRFGGELIPAGWFVRPSVRFAYASTRVRVNTLQSRNHGPFTQILISWPDPKFRLEMMTRDRGFTHKPLKGMNEVSTGNNEFDQQFISFGTSAEQVAAFLTDGVRLQLVRLQNLTPVPAVYMGIQRGQMVVKKPLHLREYKVLEEFTHLATQLYDQSMLSRAVGIEFVASTEPFCEGICQICGELITHDMIFCRRCKTPHHHDCWQYYGSCSVYGCGEEKFVVHNLSPPHPGA